MTRTLLAIVAAAAAMTFAGTAQACISCDYVPSVVHSGTTSPQARPSARVRVYRESRETRVRHREAKRSQPKHESSVKESRTAKAATSRERDAKESTAAKAAPARERETQAKTETASGEHSSIATGGSAIAQTVKTAVATEPSGPQTENSTISTGSVAAAEAQPKKAIEQATADKNVSCKKFFPSAGLTLTVPCE